MSSECKPVTSPQVECVRKMANEKGIDCSMFQQALDSGYVAWCLESLKANAATGYVPLSNARINRLETSAAKVHARIHVIRRVLVKQNRHWDWAIQNGAPQTHPDALVRTPQVKTQYLPVSEKEEEMDIVLLNYPKGYGRVTEATEWAKRVKLEAANPREVLAIGEQHPGIHMLLSAKYRVRSMHVLSPVKCLHERGDHLCCVRWCELKRDVYLHYVYLNAEEWDWYAFRG